MNQRPFVRHRVVGTLLALLVSTILAAPPAIAQTVADVPSPLDVAAPGYPKVELIYSFVPFDRGCSALAGVEIEQEWIDELEAKVGTFQQYWDREGPRLLATVVELTGTPFLRRDVTATMTLCKFRSMSLPLLLNMRRFLESTRDEEPEPMFLFGALVLHELLHTYVVDQIETSYLTDEKYADEPGSVRSHVHLMALMKATYLKLGREDELAEIIARDSQLGPIYARAWEIVNEIEGHEAFLDEIAC